MILPLADTTLHVLAQLPEPGGYFSPVKLAVMFLLAIPGLAAGPWVYRDTQRIRLPVLTWCATVLGCFALGMTFWLLVPVYMIGLLFYVLLAGGGYFAYVLYRNSKVEPRYRVLTAGHISALLKGKGGKAKAPKEDRVKSKCRIYGADTALVHPPAAEGEDADPAKLQGYNLAQEILFEMVWRRASQADIVPRDQQAVVRYVIDGVPTDRLPMNVSDSEALAQYLKSVAGLEVDQKRRPQEGKIAVEVTEGAAEDIYVRVAGTNSGQRIQLRSVTESVYTQLDELGMSEDVLSTVLELSQGTGLMIVSGPSQSGVTSTLYSLMKKQDAFIQHLMTMEQEPVIDLENITQNTYEGPDHLQKALASALRRDPDVVMIDACKKAEAAQLIQSAAADHLMFLGMSAGDTFTALAKWVKLCGSKPTAIDNLKAVTCQVLLRKLCENCREPYKPDQALLAKANLPRQGIDRFYRPPTEPLTDEKGNTITCPACQGSGYVGRTAAFELLRITDQVREMIHSGASLTQIKAACRKDKMLYLQEQALRKVIQGQTSIQEVLRATQGKKKQ
jgi:type II secretory ATPase GspE/PulE/Tfp pilus assembly ATPase PilB-like protein